MNYRNTAIRGVIVSILVGGGIVLIAASGFLSLAVPVLGPEVVVDQPQRLLNDITPGQEYDLECMVHNRTGRSMRILGSTSACGTNGCIVSKVTEPIDLPGHGTATFPVALKIAVEDSFKFEAEVFIDAGELRTIPFFVQGTSAKVQPSK